MALTICSQAGAVLQAPPIHRRFSGRIAIGASLPMSTPLRQKLSLAHQTSAARFRVLASQSPAQSQSQSQSPPSESSKSELTGATRTVTTILTLAFSLSRLFASSLRKHLALSSLPSLTTISSGAGALFFATMEDTPSGTLNTPLTVVAAGLAKWLDIYSGVLMVRVLLSWFPNIPWDRQPLSAIRDLCDPYLSLFRNIIPPVFNTLDVSPLLAFAILGVLGSILKGTVY